jgi:y4mF family transcriptional regulator
MKLSKFVKQQRKLYGMTQQELSDRAGVGLRFVREVERGKPTLRMDKINILLELFGHELVPAPIVEEETEDA